MSNIILLSKEQCKYIINHFYHGRKFYWTVLLINSQARPLPALNVRRSELEGPLLLWVLKQQNQRYTLSNMVPQAETDAQKILPTPKCLHLHYFTQKHSHWVLLLLHILPKSGVNVLLFGKITQVKAPDVCARLL